MREKTLQTVCVMDPAIDTSAMKLADMTDFIQTRDISKLKFKPGMQPTVFTIERVPHDLWEAFVMGGSNDSERARRCFRAGVVSVRNLYGDDGVAITTWTRGNSDRVMDDESLQRFSPAEREDIGNVIWTHSFLALRAEPNWRLPPTLVEPLERLTYRRADASPSEPATSSASQSPESEAPQSQQPKTETTPSGSVGDSDSPTDATAQATT